MPDPNRRPVKDQRVYNPYLHNQGEYLEAIHRRAKMIEMGSVGWEHIGDTGRMGGDYRTIISILRPWLNDFAAKEPEHENRLSGDQKKHIISSLDGSCVQEDWDVLKAHLPKLIRDLIMRTFLEVLVIKEIHTRFFENPFWYFDGKTGSLDQTGDDGFAVRMQSGSLKPFVLPIQSKGSRQRTTN